MAALEELKELEDRVRQRMQELRPLVAEFEELEQVAKRLGVDTDQPAPVARRRRSTATRSRSRASTNGGSTSARTRTPRGSRASATKSARTRTRTRGRSKSPQARGERAEQLLQIVKKRPGITVREAAQELQVDPTYLYRVVRQLERSGSVKKNGRELQPT